MTSLSPTTLYPPRVMNRTAGLEVASIEVLPEPSPRYQITVKNVSTQPAVNFHFVTYQGDRRMLSGHRGNPDASPVVAPGGTYAFTLPPAPGAPTDAREWTLASHDAIEIAAVLWEDGSIEGDPAPMASALSIYIGRATQLGRGLAVFEARRSADGLLLTRAQLQAQLERLSIEPDDAVLATTRSRVKHLGDIDENQVIGALRYAMAATRNGMLDDVREAPDDAASFQRWLTDIVALYETWQTRLAQR